MAEAHVSESLGSASKPKRMTSAKAQVIGVIERLIGKGYDLRIYDRNVNIAALVRRQSGLLSLITFHIFQG